jgi:hypothetical protein
MLPVLCGHWVRAHGAEGVTTCEQTLFHITSPPGLNTSPAVARRLHHGRDLEEPFDFLTWFEFAPEHAAAFEELVLRLRETEESTYIEREIDLRLAR